MIVYYRRVENERIISQIVWVNEACDQIVDRVSKKVKICHITTKKDFKLNMKNMGLSLQQNGIF